MMRHKSWVLTDVQNDVYIHDLSLSGETLSVPHCSVRKRTLRGGLRDGVDIVEVDNGALSFTVLPTRGMGLWRGDYRGNPLGWKAPVRGPVHPKFVDLHDRAGLGWLTGFDELLCRCGLAYNAGPGEDLLTDKAGRTRRQQITLHGRIANLPAHHVEVRVNLDAPHEISVVGKVEETGLFYPRYELTSRFTTIPGSNRLVIHDVVQNLGTEPVEMQMLYHCNLGPPFLGAGSRVVTPIREMAPQTHRAAEGMATYESYPGPTIGFAEQVYLHEVLADAHGRSLGLLTNAAADRGVALRWQPRELPCFSVWKNCAAIEDGYVTGLEPGTNFPNFKSFERRQGRVPTLAAVGKWECTWSLEVMDTAAEVAKVLAEIVALQAQARPTIHQTPNNRFSPMD